MYQETSRGKKEPKAKMAIISGAFGLTPTYTIIQAHQMYRLPVSKSTNEPAWQNSKKVLDTSVQTVSNSPHVENYQQTPWGQKNLTATKWTVDAWPHNVLNKKNVKPLVKPHWGQRILYQHEHLQGLASNLPWRILFQTNLRNYIRGLRERNPTARRS